jgi:hypothetical protein
METEKVKRKGPTCLYCSGNHTYNRCQHPDIVQFSNYLENLYKDLYRLKATTENKSKAAYNLLSDYSINLLITAGRRATDFCQFKKTYADKKRIYTKEEIINDLTSCMFHHFRFEHFKNNIPDLIEGRIDNTSYLKGFTDMISSSFIQQPEPSAPPTPLQDINIEYKDIHGPTAPPTPLQDINIEYKDIHGPTAPPMEMPNKGGKRKYTIRKKYKKSRKNVTRKY